MGSKPGVRARAGTPRLRRLDRATSSVGIAAAPAYAAIGVLGDPRLGGVRDRPIAAGIAWFCAMSWVLTSEPAHAAVSAVARRDRRYARARCR
jgi:hypothetical protein